MTAPAAPVIPRFLERTVTFDQIRADSDGSGDGRTFDGYAAVFDSLTRIDSWEGYFDEKIARGAFRKTIRERMPVLQFDHGRHPYFGSMPIGAIRKLHEDDRGLHVDARLHGSAFFEPLREAIASESINGMSFRFEVVKEDWHYQGRRITDPDEVLRLIWRRMPDMTDDDVIVRTLKELKVPELGPVVFPAYPDTTASVRFDARSSMDDEVIRIQVRNSIARAMNVKAAETRDDPDVENPEQPDNITTESVPEPAQPDTESNEAPEEDESLDEHSEESGDESPTEGHSEPDSETPTGGRDNTPPVPTNLDAEERRLARLRMAESFRGRHTAALARSKRYA